MTVQSDRIVENRTWCIVVVVVLLVLVEVTSLNGPNVCMVKQKYNITKRVKYRAPMSIRTYEWCFSMPPRCSKWNTEMRDLTRLETEERTAEVAVCCPGYKMKEVSCVPICPLGKTGHGCSEDCPPNKWGPNCVNNCSSCDHGTCSPITGECHCEDGWQGESCSFSMPSTTSSTTMMEEILTTVKPTTKISLQTTTKPTEPTTRTITTEITRPNTTPMQVISTIIPSSPPTTSSTLSLSTTTTTKTTYEIFSNTTMSPAWTVRNNDLLKAPTDIVMSSNYNRTETPIDNSSNGISTEVKISVAKKNTTLGSVFVTSTSLPSTTTLATTSLIKLTVKETTAKKELLKKPDTTVKVTTTKIKPKEIWIRPTQRGESTFIENKIKNIEQSHSRYKSATKNEEVSEFTTPRTIIVSIIPTSVSYVTFKKIALTTASYIYQKSNISLQHQKTDGMTEQAATKPLTSLTQPSSTPMPFTIRILSTLLLKNTTSPTTASPLSHKSTTKIILPKHAETSSNATTISSTMITTNSMPATLNGANKKLNFSNILTSTSSSTNNRTTQGINTNGTTPKFSESTVLIRQTTTQRSTTYESASKSPITTTSLRSKSVYSPKKVTKYHGEKIANVTVKPTKFTPNLGDVLAKTTKLLAIKHSQKTNVTKKNETKIFNSKSNAITTAGPLEDETFHILTEPEHITAVMADRGRDHSTVDLISVISIAGGIMMAIITIAVIIVMVERCKRPRYEDVRKINDIRMQVMIDNNDNPPPYVRSIFHTPLPEPPTLDKCHYQPISTLDRNLKQFMRPVVVQTISPIMLENFRGILECHYDHLPQRNYDCSTHSTRCSVTPSMACTEELCGERALSVTDYTIEALKCEAKLDVIDNTTSEPLYAEIPCWRPPSEHAIEVLNLNGEAITEL